MVADVNNRRHRKCTLTEQIWVHLRDPWQRHLEGQCWVPGIPFNSNMGRLNKILLTRWSKLTLGITTLIFQNSKADLSLFMFSGGTREQILPCLYPQLRAHWDSMDHQHTEVVTPHPLTHLIQWLAKVKIITIQMMSSLFHQEPMPKPHLTHGTKPLRLDPKHPSDPQGHGSFNPS